MHVRIEGTPFGQSLAVLATIGSAPLSPSSLRWHFYSVNSLDQTKFLFKKRAYYWYILLHCCRPIVFSMDGDSTYEADFVLATLVDHDSSLPPSQASVTASANTSTKSVTSKDKQAKRWEGLHITLTEESDHLTTRPSHLQRNGHQEIDSCPTKNS